MERSGGQSRPQEKKHSTIESIVELADALDKLPWGTILGGLIVLIAAVLGGVLVAIGNSSLDFDSYVNDLSKLAIGVGLVAVGRGIHKQGKAEAQCRSARHCDLSRFPPTPVPL